jgi:hypothetical protein
MKLAQDDVSAVVLVLVMSDFVFLFVKEFVIT